MIAAAIHVVLVVSVAAQPLDVNRAEPGSRSLVWPFHNDTVHRLGPGADFFALYFAGVHASIGESPFSESVHPDRDPPYHYSYRYLPLAAQSLGRVATWLPPRIAYVAWLGVIEAALFGFLFVFARCTAHRGTKCGASCALLLSSPYFIELHMGQFTFVTVAAAAMAVLLLIRGGRHDVAIAGVLFAVSAFLKIFSIVMAPALVKHPKGRWLVGAASVAIVLGGLPFFVAHPEDWPLFRAVNFQSHLPALDAGNFSLLYSIWLGASKLGVDWTPEGWATFALVWRAALLGVTTMFVLVSPVRAFVGAAGLLLVAHFASYHHVWEHHYSAAVIAGLLLVRWIQSGSRENEPTKVPIDSPSSGSRMPRTLVAILWVAIVWMVVPSPFFIFDDLKDATQWVTPADWTFSKYFLLAMSKAAPLTLMYCAGMVYLLSLFSRSSFRMWRRSV